MKVIIQDFKHTFSNYYWELLIISKLCLRRKNLHKRWSILTNIHRLLDSTTMEKKLTNHHAVVSYPSCWFLYWPLTLSKQSLTGGTTTITSILKTRSFWKKRIKSCNLLMKLLIFRSHMLDQDRVHHLIRTSSLPLSYTGIPTSTMVTSPSLRSRSILMMRYR